MQKKPAVFLCLRFPSSPPAQTVPDTQVPPRRARRNWEKAVQPHPIAQAVLPCPCRPLKNFPCHRAPEAKDFGSRNRPSHGGYSPPYPPLCLRLQKQCAKRQQGEPQRAAAEKRKCPHTTHRRSKPHRNDCPTPQMSSEQSRCRRMQARPEKTRRNFCKTRAFRESRRQRVPSQQKPTA